MTEDGRPPLPTIIQGGMGVAISSWQLAAAVARAGELGVVSGTALEIVYARRLQLGDPGGHVRRALVRFPVPAMARRVLAAYYVHGGKAAQEPYRKVPMFTVEPEVALQELTVVANFCEVFLAKEGHDGLVGINYLRKIELPMPFACLGALLAGVDVILTGAGNPAEMPGLLRRLADRQDVELEVRTQGMTSADRPCVVRCSPNELLGPAASASTAATTAAATRFLAIVASVDLAAGLAVNPATRPFGFVVEGPSAGGHNAPPRGPRRVDAEGQPIYDERDSVDLASMRAVGLPFWLAGSYGTPAGLAAARAAGAAGIQVGTAFAYSAESGLDEALKRRILGTVLDGTVRVRTDWRASPTGFPFKIVQISGTLSDPEVAEARQQVCDLGVLRTPYKRPDGVVDYRCPSEPIRVYVGRKGGRAATADGRRCICNALMAAAGYPQQRPRGKVEPAIVTSGTDFGTVEVLQRRLRPEEDFYPAAAVIDYLRGAPAVGTARA